MLLDDIGRVAADHWLTIPTVFPQVECDAFVVMPNHVHGIVVINHSYIPSALARHPNSSNKHYTLGVVIGNYKAVVTRQINRVLGNRAPRLWQERFHDHIIRNEHSLNHFRQYIQNNPALWDEDSLYSPKMTK